MRVCFALSLSLAIATGLFAQEFRSTLTGRVTDPSGAAIPNAKVVAVKTETQGKFETVATADGLYTIPFLPPGMYQLRAEAPGFRSYVQSGITVAADMHVAQDIRLTIGDTTQAVTVTADAAPLESVTASAGQAITTHEVESLPINGRAPMDLVILGYGAVNVGTRDQNRPFEQSGQSNFSLGGTASGSSAALIDGVPNIGTTGTSGTLVSFSPAVDAVEEVKVEAFNVDASYGGMGGGTVEITTKSGGNQFHGALSEFNQLSVLAATPFFTNASGSKKTPYGENQFGFAVGGPVWIPKVYNGRNKFFFFGAYEHYGDRDLYPTYFTVPTAAERTGDFSRLLSLNNGSKNYTLYDPSTAAISGSTVVRQPFPGNIIPQARLNPIAGNFLNSFVPLPNLPGNYDDTNNFITGEHVSNHYDSYSGRSDMYLGGKDKLTFSGRESYWLQTGSQLADNPAYWDGGGRTIWGGMVDEIHTFSPTMVGDLRLGFNRHEQFSSLGSQGYDPTQLGFPSYIKNSSNELMVPTFKFTDGYSGNSTTQSTYASQPYNTFQLFNSYTKILGAHSIKFGGEARLLDYSSITFANTTGYYQFDSGTWVKANSNASNPSLGGSMAQFLLGLPTSGEYDIDPALHDDSRYSALFVSDDWHARPNLTVNLGLRWEYGTPTTERDNRQVIGFNSSAVNMATKGAEAAYALNPLPQMAASAYQPTGGLVFADSSNRTPYTTPRTAFSPRLGLSWSPASLHNKTVIRAGTGIFYYNYGVIPSQQPGFTAVTQYVASNNSWLTPASTLSNPFPNGIQQPVGGSLGVNTFLGNSITYINPSLQNQYSLRWNFDIQEQLPADTVLEIGYIGNHSVHLTTNYNFAALPSQYLSRSPVRDTATINALGAIVPNPFAGLLPGTGANGSTTTVAGVLQAYPEFTGVTEASMNNGGSYYHALNVKVQKRLSKGLQFVVNFTHSRQMDSVTYLNSGSLALQNEVSSYDRPNNFVFSSTYDLPFGRGMAFGAKTNRAVNFVLGNWAVAGVYDYHSGAPLSWGNVIYNGGALNYDASNVSHAFDTTSFNTVSSQQLSANFRTFPSRFNNLRVDATNNINLTATKNFHVTERVRLQFRAEAFNVANHPLFGGPNLSPTSASFGIITSQTNSPRAVQFAMRLTF